MAPIARSSTADAANRLRANPPSSWGLSKKSPTTAPSGLVRIKAVQKRSVLDIEVFQ
jgi:hypothetical protein